MDNAIEDFMLGSGLTLKELADKHDVCCCLLQKKITERLRIHGQINSLISEIEAGG
jgi:hypothetical protein